MSISTEFNLGRPSGGRRIDPESPLRILVLADWLGDAQASVPLAERRPLKIDIDNFHQVMARLAPRVHLGGAEALEFADIEDFHPDRLCRRLPALKSLIQLYRDLDDPTRVQALIDSLEPPTESASADSPSGDTATDLERLLGGRPSGQARVQDEQSRIRKMLGELVAPHLVDTRSAEPHRKAVVARLAEELNKVLHAPGFQSLEANWRGLWWLVSQLVSEEVQMAVLPVTEDEIRADLQAAGTNLETAALTRHIAGSPTSAPWSLVVGLFEFGPQVEDIMALTAMAVIAEVASVPLIAAASPQMVGCDAPSDLVDPARWAAGPEGEAMELWQALRQSSAGQWISLVLPGVIARLPYGPETDPIDSIEFSESAARASSLPRFSGALAVAAALGIQFENYGGDMDPGTPVALDDLPGFSFSEDGEARFQSAVEVALPDRALDALVQRGLTPLSGAINRTDVHVPGCFSLAG
ncbi:MAG: type VI secretion system contractile sheath large subunit, partial [Wenzhouxiangella sp.]|nr:type VI secretion system contractile sheath large subunit [Wenzhouxiangella sp.]